MIRRDSLVAKNLYSKVLAGPIQGARCPGQCLVSESLSFFDPLDRYLDP